MEFSTRLLRCTASVFLLASAPLLCAQQNPMKAGLWETTVTINRVMALPPEAEARIAAMPPAQQAQVRAMMGGAGGGQPMVTTRQECVAPQTTMDSMLNRAQQSSGMTCTLTNKTQTANGASFDISCTGAMGAAKGHTEFRRVDDDHVTSSSHMTVTATSHGTTNNMTIDAATTAKFVGADCGDVKPFTPPPAAH